MPQVSIICITYNHVNFIKKCLDGFVTQKTNFEFEIIIHDDCSTDGTTEIIQEYEAKYPHLFKCFYEDENQYEKGNLSKFAADLYNKCKGKYIALCDGDDYWTDENKLQKQVAFLENNPDYSICFHPVKVIYENGEKKDSIFPEKKMIKKGFTFENLLKINFIQINSVMYRWAFQNKDFSNYFSDEMQPGDWYLHLLHAKDGKIGYLDKVMSVYRKHPNGIWFEQNKEKHLLKNGLKILRFFYNVYKNITNSSQDYLTNILEPVTKDIAEIYGKNLDSDSLIKMKEIFPEFDAQANIQDLKGDCRKKYKKYKKLFNVFLTISIILSIICITLVLLLI